MINDFWIPITFSSEETEENLQLAVGHCHLVHVYTLEQMNNYFAKHAETLRYANFRPELLSFIKEDRMTNFAQYYSLIHAAEATFPYFAEHKSFGKPVEPINQKDYTTIQIKARKIWRKYMSLNDLITTAYGTIYLDENWTEIAISQAETKKLFFWQIPDAMHSITLDIASKKIFLNLYETGRKREKALDRKSQK